MHTKKWDKLAKWLVVKSTAICDLNGCTADSHRCESYAYIDADGSCHDICASDYWLGQTYPIAAIPMPWTGNGTELRDAVMSDIE